MLEQWLKTITIISSLTQSKELTELSWVVLMGPLHHCRVGLESSQSPYHILV